MFHVHSTPSTLGYIEFPNPSTSLPLQSLYAYDLISAWTPQIHPQPVFPTPVSCFSFKYLLKCHPSLDALVDLLPLTSHPSLNLVVLLYGLHSTHHSVPVCLFTGIPPISCIFSASALESPWRQKRNLCPLSSGPSP